MYGTFSKIADRYADQIAVTNERSSATFGELKRQTEALTAFFRRSRRTERVSVAMAAIPGGPELTALQLACMGAGVALAPVPEKITTHETRNYLQRIAPDLIVVESPSAAAPLLAAMEETVTLLSLANVGDDVPPHRAIAWNRVIESPSDVEPVRFHGADLPNEIVLIQFTSGSTGIPKGILLSNDNIAAYLEKSRDFLFRFAERHVFCPMPQFHAFGGTVVMEHIFHGASVHLANRFMPGEDMARMARHGCAVIQASPNYIKLMLKLGVLTREALPHLDTIIMGTAAADRALIADIRALFPDLNIHLRYGLTETMGPITRLTIGAGDELDRPGLVGPPLPGVLLADDIPRMGADEPKEVRVKSRVVAAGALVGREQWRRITDDDGYFATGDMGFIDDDGMLHLRGRISTFIKRNGFRINPFEIEELLRSAAGVQEAVVVGVPDPDAGQKIVACVEPVPGETALDTKLLMSFCREKLSPHKHPQRIEVMADLPRTQVGKPDRNAIRERVPG